MTLLEKIKKLNTKEKIKLFNSLKDTKTKDEAISLLNELGFTASFEELDECLDYQMHRQELSDLDLENINSGNFYDNVWCSNEDEVKFIAEVGDYVEVYIGWFDTSVKCKITNRKINYLQFNIPGNGSVVHSGSGAYHDIYYCECEVPHWFMDNDWRWRAEIRKPCTKNNIA